MLSAPPRLPPAPVFGAALLVVNVIVQAVCIWQATTREAIFSSSPSQGRTLALIAPTVLATSLLVVGLIYRRWWQSAIAPLVVLVGSFLVSTWIMNFPEHVAENEWSPERAGEVIDAVTTAWHATLLLTVVVGWGLIRRAGWWWLLGLLPSVLVIALVVVAGREVMAIDATWSAGREGFERAFAEQVRNDQLTVLAISAAAVAVCAWLCVLAERRAPHLFERVEQGRNE